LASSKLASSKAHNREVHEIAGIPILNLEVTEKKNDNQESMPIKKDKNSTLETPMGS
jgi:hypothetical protein